MNLYKNIPEKYIHKVCNSEDFDFLEFYEKHYKLLHIIRKIPILKYIQIGIMGSIDGLEDYINNLIFNLTIDLGRLYLNHCSQYQICCNIQGYKRDLLRIKSIKDYFSSSMDLYSFDVSSILLGDPDINHKDIEVERDKLIDFIAEKMNTDYFFSEKFDRFIIDIKIKEDS